MDKEVVGELTTNNAKSLFKEFSSIN